MCWWGNGLMERRASPPVQAERSSAVAVTATTLELLESLRLRNRLAFANLLPPHRVIQAFSIK